MDPFEEMKENLRQIIAIQAKSTKEIAELRAEEEKRQEKRNAEFAESRAEHAAWQAEEAKRQEKRNAELAELRAEHAAWQAEEAKRQEKRNAEFAESRAEHAAWQAEEAKRQEKRNAELAELRAEHAAWQAEEAKRQEKRNAELVELRAQNEKERIELRQSLKSIGQKLGSIGMNNGDFAEELFYTSLKENPVLGDQKYDIVLHNVYDPNGSAEYDILMHNGESTAIVEVKYKARIPDIYDLLGKKTTAFRKGFTGLRHHKLYLGLASTIISEELIGEAREAGIFLLGQKGQSYEVVNENVRSF